MALAIGSTSHAHGPGRPSSDRTTAATGLPATSRAASPNRPIPYATSGGFQRVAPRTHGAPRLMRGPNLSGGVDPECAEDLQAALEQRARIEQVREWGHWDYGDARLRVALEALYGQIHSRRTLMLLIALPQRLVKFPGSWGPDSCPIHPLPARDAQGRRGEAALRDAARRGLRCTSGQHGSGSRRLEPIHVTGTPFPGARGGAAAVRAAEAMEMETPPRARAVSRDATGRGRSPASPRSHISTSPMAGSRRAGSPPGSSSFSWTLPRADRSAPPSPPIGSGVRARLPSSTSTPGGHDERTR